MTHRMQNKKSTFKFSERGGWTHVCSQGYIHVFSSKLGTQPIYSDSNTMREKYKRAITPWRTSAVVFSLIASASIVLQLVFQHDLLLLNMLGGLALVLAAPSLMTYMGLVLRLRQLNKG